MFIQARLAAITAVQSGLDIVYRQRLSRYPALRALLVQMTGAKSTGVGSSDSIALYETVLNRKPKAILELGAGQSSAVIALAGKISGTDPQFIAVEENQNWLEYHLKVIPKELRPLIQFERKDTAAGELDGQPAAFYVDLPRLAYEMVHVDGPDHLARGAHISRDIIDMIPALAPSCIVIFDGREASARASKHHLERAGFKCSRHPFTMSYTFTR